MALVTGASRKIGLGAAIARELAEAGANIFLTFIRAYDASMPWGSNRGEVEELLHELKAKGAGADGYELDLADSAAPAKLFERIEKSFGPQGATSSLITQRIPSMMASRPSVQKFSISTTR